MAGTRPRLTFASSDGVTILEGADNCTGIELLESFVHDRLWFGNPPYLIEVRDVPVDEPFIGSVAA